MEKKTAQQEAREFIEIASTFAMAALVIVQDASPATDAETATEAVDMAEALLAEIDRRYPLPAAGLNPAPNPKEKS